jgi:hypothetical protein
LEIEQTIGAIRSQAIEVTGDGGLGKRDAPAGECEMHIQVDDLRDLRSGAGLEEVVSAGKTIEFLPLDFWGPIGPCAIEFAPEPDLKKRETALPKIKDAETGYDKVGLGVYCGEQWFVDASECLGLCGGAMESV